MKVTKETIRIILVFIFSLVFLFRLTEFYDLISSSLILLLLLFDLIESNHNDSAKSAIIYYLSWVVIALVTFYDRRNYFGPLTPIIIVLILKVITAIAFVLKYKQFQVTRTILSKLSLLAIALYLIELIINSTHGLASYAVFLTIISTIELGIILLIEKQRIIYKSTVLTYLQNN